MSKKILLITQWFDPEPTFKGLLFAKELSKRGFDVEVITGFPNYPGGKIYPGYKLKLFQKEKYEGVTVMRLPLFPSHNSNKLGRILNYLSFFLSSTIYGIFFARKPNLIYAYHPPLTTGIAAIIIKFFKKVPLVYDIQDLWPDSLSATGMLNNKIFLKIISSICSYVYFSVDKIVVLSEGFKEILVKRNVPIKKIEVIYNWADEDILRSASKKIEKSLFEINNFNILFAGNVGKAQKLNVVLEACDILNKESNKIKFFILGQGIMLEYLKKESKRRNLNNLEFLESVPMNEVGKFLYSADALFIHLKKDKLFQITIPGKTQAYMSVGKPIIMGIDGNAAQLISKAKCGVIIESENADELANAARYLSNLESNQLNKLGKNASIFYDKNLSIDVGLNKFSLLFNELSK